MGNDPPGVAPELPPCVPQVPPAPPDVRATVPPVRRVPLAGPRADRRPPAGPPARQRGGGAVPRRPSPARPRCAAKKEWTGTFVHNRHGAAQGRENVRSIAKGVGVDISLQWPPLAPPPTELS